MGQNKVNERIAMTMLRQCALVWEHCTMLFEPAAEFECRFADIYKGIYNTKNQCNVTPGHIDIGIDQCQHPDVFTQRMREIEGTVDYMQDGRQTIVKMFFQTSDTEPQIGFSSSYPVEMVFEVVRNFCRINGCSGLLDKTKFGMDDSGKWARLPQSSAIWTPVKKTAAKAKVENRKPETQPESTMSDRLREALLRQLKQAA